MRLIYTFQHDGLVQGRSITDVLTMEILQSYTEPLHMYMVCFVVVK